MQIIAIQQIIAELILAVLILMKFQKAVYMPTLIRTENLSTDPGSKFRGASFLNKLHSTKNEKKNMILCPNIFHIEI